MIYYSAVRNVAGGGVGGGLRNTRERTRTAICRHKGPPNCYRGLHIKLCTQTRNWSDQVDAKSNKQ